MGRNGLTKNRERLLAGDVAATSPAIVRQALPFTFCADAALTQATSIAKYSYGV